MPLPAFVRPKKVARVPVALDEVMAEMKATQDHEALVVAQATAFIADQAQVNSALEPAKSLGSCEADTHYDQQSGTTFTPAGSSYDSAYGNAHYVSGSSRNPNF